MNGNGDSAARFSGKVAIVTGAASGIGLAVAKRFGREGAKVVVADLNRRGAEKAAGEVKSAGAPDAFGSACDVSAEEQVGRTVSETLDRFGRWDVLVNNAGLMVFKALDQLTTDDWLKVWRVDLMGAFYFPKQAFSKMSDGGAIVNVSSVHARETTAGVAPYAAAKAALLSLTRSAALEGKPKGLRVNAILPGAVDTPMLWNNPNVKSGLEKIQRADVGKPEDLAAVIAFLASPGAEFVQGASILVDGGRLTHL
jgi:meso-butanediol dehydrogenase/(S,S)-butanediol dehydrogenase/diacetyl reductase